MNQEQKPELSTIIITKLEDLIRQVRDTLFNASKQPETARSAWDAETEEMIKKCYNE